MNPHSKFRRISQLLNWGILEKKIGVEKFAHTIHLKYLCS